MPRHSLLALALLLGACSSNQPTTPSLTHDAATPREQQPPVADSAANLPLPETSMVAPQVESSLRQRAQGNVQASKTASRPMLPAPPVLSTPQPLSRRPHSQSRCTCTSG